MKTCFKCSAPKPISDFYVNLNKCKECTKADAKAHRLANLEKVRAYDRARGSRQTKEYSRKYYAANKEKSVAWGREERMTEAGKARELVSRAVRKGALSPAPCLVCGASPAHAHHEDYSRPLDVVWLCPVHHGARHRELNELERKVRNVPTETLEEQTA